MQDINLIPYDVVLQEDLYRRLRLWAAAFVGIGLLLFAFFLIQKHIVSKIDDDVRQLESRNRVLKARYEEVKQLQTKQAELGRKARIVDALLAKRNFTQFFIELQRSMPPSIRLKQLTLDIKNYDLEEGEEVEWVETGYFVVKKPEPQNKRSKSASSEVPNIDISGIALSHDDLARFIDALGRSPRFHHVNLRQCRTDQREKNRIEFEVDAQLRK